MQTQIQILLVVEEVEAATVVDISQPNTRSNVKVAKLQKFNRKTEKVLGFLTVYKLYIKIRMKEIVVKEHIQWVFLYI